jgi:hypothetical protein
MLRAVEVYRASGYGGPDAKNNILQSVPTAVASAQPWLEAHLESQATAKIVHLVEGFALPFGLDLPMGIHWITMRDHPVTEQHRIERTLAWAEYTLPFPADEMRLARRLPAESDLIASVRV